MTYYPQPSGYPGGGHVSTQQYASQTPAFQPPFSQGTADFRSHWGQGQAVVTGNGFGQIGPFGVSSGVPYALPSYGGYGQPSPFPSLPYGQQGFSYGHTTPSPFGPGAYLGYGGGAQYPYSQFVGNQHPDRSNHYNLYGDGRTNLFLQGYDPAVPRNQWGSSSYLTSQFGTYQTNVGSQGGYANANMFGAHATGAGWARVGAAGNPGMTVDYASEAYYNTNFNNSWPQSY